MLIYFSDDSECEGGYCKILKLQFVNYSNKQTMYLLFWYVIKNIFLNKQNKYVNFYLDFNSTN